MNNPAASQLISELQQDSFVREALEMQRDREHARADKECQLAKAISNLGFAWEVLRDDVDNAHFSYIPHDLMKFGKRLAISKTFSVDATINPESKLASLVIGDRVPYGGAEEQVIVRGPSKKDMSTRYYEFEDDFGCLSPERLLDKIVVLPHFAPEINLLSSRTDSLIRYIDLPARKRAALQRYHQKHPKPFGARW